MRQWPAEASLKVCEVRGCPSGGTGINLLVFYCCPLSCSPERAVDCWFVFLWLPLHLPFSILFLLGFVVFPGSMQFGPLLPGCMRSSLPSTHPFPMGRWWLCKAQNQFYSFAREGYFQYYFSITAILLPDCWMYCSVLGRWPEQDVLF